MDETWIHRCTPESRKGSKQWIKPSGSAPKRPKMQQLAGKVMDSVFWDAHGIISIGYLEKGRTITGVYYAALLDRFVEEIGKKWPHLKRKKILFHYDNAPSHTSNIAQAKSMNWVSNRFRIHCIFQTLPPATIICSQTSKDSCVVGVLGRTKKGILEGLTNRIIWKA